MKASDVMSAPVHVISPTETVAHARHLMVKHHISRLLVMEGEVLEGIITKKDLAYRLRQSGPAWRRRPIDRIPVRVIAVPDPIVVTPETGIREIAGIFIEQRISSVPVSDGDVVIGIVTKSDLMKSRLIRGLTCPVEAMMEDVATVSRYHSLDHVIDVMSERNDKVVVTNNDNTIAGIISETNLAFFDNGQKMAGAVERGVTVRKRKQPRGVQGGGFALPRTCDCGRYHDLPGHHHSPGYTGQPGRFNHVQTPDQQPCGRGEQRHCRHHKTG
jgi:CBS domain-containing protein